MFKLIAVVAFVFSSTVMAEAKINCVHNEPTVKNGNSVTQTTLTFSVSQGETLIRYAVQGDNRLFEKTLYHTEKIDLAKYIDRDMQALPIIANGLFYAIRFDITDRNLIAHFTLGLVKDNLRTNESGADFNFSVNNTQTLTSSPEFGDLNCHLSNK